MFQKLSELQEAKDIAQQNLTNYLQNDFWQWFDNANNLVPLDCFIDGLFSNDDIFETEINIVLPNPQNLEIWTAFDWPIFGECELSDGCSSTCGNCLYLSFNPNYESMNYLRENQHNIYTELTKKHPEFMENWC